MRFRTTGLFLLTAGLQTVFGFNHPEIKWKSVSTEHFIINFYDKTQEAVYPTWKIAEEVYTALSAAYDYKLDRKINISLADYDDYSNGWADWTAANVMIWVPDMRIELRSNTVWLRNVINHELTHIFSLQKKRRLQVIDISANLSASSPGAAVAWLEPFAKVSLPPEWMAEGLAQMETQHLGHDCWDSRRDMLLRCNVLDKKEFSLDEMGVFNHDDAGNEMVYNQGMSFSNFIEQRIGVDAYRSIWRQSTSEKVNFYRLLSEKTLGPVSRLYTEWLDSVRTACNAMVPRPSSHAATIWDRGYYNLLPRVSRDGKYQGWLTSDGDDFGRTDLVIARYGASKVIRRICYATTGWTFGNNGTVYFVRAHDPNRNGSYFNDLFSSDIATGHERRLSHDGRIYDVAISPDFAKIACIRYDSGAFMIDTIDLTTLQRGTVVNGVVGEPFMNLCYNPRNQKQLVVSRVINGWSKLFLLSGDSLAALRTGGAGQEESPFWADDGRIYYSADYDGIFNIYSVAPSKPVLPVVNANDTAARHAPDTLLEVVRHTDAIGGHFSPFVAPDHALITSSFSSKGFAIVNNTPAARAWSMPAAYRCAFDPLPTPKGKVTIKARDYDATLLRSSWELQIFGDLQKSRNSLLSGSQSGTDTLSYEAGAGLFGSRSDALGKEEMSLGVAAGVLNSTYGGAPSGDATVNQHGEAIKPLALQLQQIKEFAMPASEKSAVPQFGKFTTMYTDPRVYRKFIQNAVTASDSSSSDSLPQIMPFLQPVIGWQNNMTAATLGLSLQAMMAEMIVPTVINADLYGEWQLTRDLTVGIAPSAELLPFFQGPSKVFGVVPLFLSWQHIGYENKDINYNLADVSVVQVMGGPEFDPLVLIDGPDTLYKVLQGVEGGISVEHGFPVTHYGSVLVSAASMIDNYDSPVSDPTEVLDGTAITYVSGELDVNGMVPLIPTIDKKVGLYLDALYAQIGYSLWVRANGHGLRNLNDYSAADLLTKDNADPFGIRFGHVITGGINLGSYKTFTYFRTLSMSISYELLSRGILFSLTME